MDPEERSQEGWREGEIMDEGREGRREGGRMERKVLMLGGKMEG